LTWHEKELATLLVPSLMVTVAVVVVPTSITPAVKVNLMG